VNGPLVAYAPGGGTDAIARSLASQQQGVVLGQPVVVGNKPGAGGNIATETAATVRPDGYTLLMGNQARSRSTRRCSRASG
jgi:tripartite-type tricarboxylate transporter receptor subunit TctC